MSIMFALIKKITKAYYSLPIKRKISLSFIIIFLPILILLMSAVNRLSSTIIIDKTIENTQQNLQLVSEKLDMLSREVESYSVDVASNIELQSVLKQIISKEATHSEYIEARNILNNIKRSKTNIDAMIIFQTHNTIDSDGISINQSPNVSRVDYMTLLEKQGQDKIWLDTAKSYYQKAGLSVDIVSFLRTFNDALTGRLLGIIEMTIDEGQISSLYSNIKLGKTGQIAIINNKGTVISHHDKNMLYKDIQDKPYYQWILANEGGKIFRIQGQDYLIISNLHKSTNWIIMGMVPVAEITLENKRLTRNIFVIGFVGILFAILLSELTASTITKPIIKLKETIKQVSAGDYEVKSHIYSTDEIGILSDEFNKMIGKTSNLMSKIVIEQKKKRRFELAMLQAQIKPHFLYNTLESICGLAEIDEKEKLIDTINNLASFYRGVLSKGRDILPIEEETRLTEYYLRILKVRYPEEFDYSFQIASECEAYSMLKLCLQPIVENAIYHGIRKKRGKGVINIDGCIHNGEIVITVSDNGIGMSQQKIDALFLGNDNNDKSRSFGLKSTHERIQLYFGASYGLQIESIEGEGTTVSMTIPARKMEMR